MSPDLTTKQDILPAGSNNQAANKYVFHGEVNGLKTEVVDDGNIIYSTLTIVDADTVNAWSTHWRLLRDSWPSTQIMYSVGDFSGFNGPHLLSGIEKAQSAMQESKPITTYNAVVVPRSPVGQLIEFATRTTRFFGLAEHFQLFTNREDALRWLRVCRKNEERKQQTSR